MAQTRSDAFALTTGGTPSPVILAFVRPHSVSCNGPYPLLLSHSFRSDSAVIIAFGFRTVVYAAGWVMGGSN